MIYRALGLVFWMLHVTGVLAQAPAAPAGGYTRDEASHLFSCVGFAAHAKSIVERKQRGRPADDVKKTYLGGRLEPLMIPFIDKVYADPAPKPWEYASGFFNECAQNVASVPLERVEGANYCMFSSLISLSAQQARDSGIPKEQAYTYAPISNEASRRIIDDIYARKGTSGQEYSAAWNWCMNSFVKD
jgi:hypothetical protein